MSFLLWIVAMSCVVAALYAVSQIIAEVLDWVVDWSASKIQQRRTKR